MKWSNKVHKLIKCFFHHIQGASKEPVCKTCVLDHGTFTIPA